MSSNDLLPQLRFEISEVAKILRISRAMLYQRILDGRISVNKDGRRTFDPASIPRTSDSCSFQAALEVCG